MNQSVPKSPGPPDTPVDNRRAAPLEIAAAPPAKPSLWVRALSRIPLALWYPFARLMAYCAWRVFPYRRHVIVRNLTASFPEWDLDSDLL